MDARQEGALKDAARLLDGMAGPGWVRVQPAGCTLEKADGLPWAADPEGRAAARKELVLRLARLTVAARVLVGRQGENTSRAYVVAWPEPSGLFGREGTGWAERWAHGEGEAEKADAGQGPPPAVAASFDIIPAGAGKPYQLLMKRKRAKFSQDCLTDILWVLDLAGKRLHGPEIAGELSRRGRPWNGTSLAHTLAEARARGLLDHEAKGGYGIARPAGGEPRVVHED